MNLFSLFHRKSHVAEAAKPDDDRGWLRASALGATPLNPDRDELHGEALLRAAYEAYTTNPLAYAVAEHITDFVVGSNPQVIATDPRVQKVIDRFWHDEENNMPLRVYAIHTELSVYGEQFIRFFVDRITGRTIIRPLDPLYITAIDTSPTDREHPLRYLYKPPGVFGDAVAEDTWIPSHDILFVAINKVSSALRGRSDLAPILPWIRRYTDWLENRSRLNKLLTNLLWDVTATGASPEDISRLRALYAKPPPPATVLVHNERESWKPLVPDMHAADAAPDGRAIRLMIATGALLPEHYLAEGGNANRATAAEMGLPTTQHFKRRQGVFRHILTRIVNRVVDEAQRAGRLGPRVDRSFSIHLEKIPDLPPQASAKALESAARALALAVKESLVSREDAQHIWRRFVLHLDDSISQSEDSETGPAPS